MSSSILNKLFDLAPPVLIGISIDVVIKEKSPLVLKIGKEAFYNQIDMPLADAYKYTAEVMTQNKLVQDANE